MNADRMPPESMQLHASCIAIDGKAVLLLGASGSGKSDLALRLIDAGAMLVGDDQVIIHNTNSALLASPAPRIEGMIEVRGVGILHVPYIAQIPLILAIKLVSATEIERLPEPQFFDCLGQKVPLLLFHAFDHSTPAKIRIFLRSL